MPILSYFNNMWYGAASGSMIVEHATPEPSVSAKMSQKVAAAVEGGGVAPYLKLTRALKQTLTVEAIGEVELALPKKKLRGQCSVSIGATPSAFDIAQAIWQASSSQYNASGSMGAKLNSASSAGNPWSATPADNNDPNTMGAVVSDIKKKADMIPGLY